MRHRGILLALDLLLVGLATVCAQLLRDNFETRPDQVLALLPHLGLTVLVAIPVLTLFGLNRGIWRFSAMPDYLWAVAAAILIVTSALVIGFFVNRLEGVARSLPIIQGVLVAAGLVGARVFARLRHAGRKRGPAVLKAVPEPAGQHESVLLVGANPITELYIRSVAEFASERIAIAGLLDPKKGSKGRLFQGYEIRGSPEEVATVLKDLEVHGVLVDRIVVAMAFDNLSDEAREALLQVERTSNIRLEFFAENIGIAGRPAPKAPGEDDPAFSIKVAELETSAQRPYWRVKRALDVAGSAAAIVVLSPIMLLVTVLAAIDRGWPATFWQQRPGAGGRPFRLYKFRTMAAAHDWQGHRVPDSERSSRIGQFLRRARLDELPQLFNILLGHMSFIGPRPLLPADQPPAFAARLLVRPGLTGWAQINGGRELSPADKAVLDVWYIKKASLGLDLRIILDTARMVLLGERQRHKFVRLAWRQLGLDWVRSEKVDAVVADGRKSQTGDGDTRERAA